MNVAVFGLGKLGSPLAAFFASAGHDVVGVDVNRGFVEAVNEGHAPVEETNLQQTINGCHDRLRATMDAAAAARFADLIFVIVPTPSDEDGKFSNQYVIRACQSLAPGLANDDHERLVVIVSTVMPGSMENVIVPCLEVAAGPSNGRWGVCYNPEFIALGSVLDDLRFPDFLLIGKAQDKWGEMLVEFYYDTYTALGAPMPQEAMLSYAEAELAKLCVNAYLVTKIAYANMVGDFCESLNISGTGVCDAVGLDSRIGGKYMRPGTAPGGPCLPRDTRAVRALASTLGVSAPLMEAAEDINRVRAKLLANKIVACDPRKVAVLGLAYKPFTAVVEESATLALLGELRCRSSAEVVVYDPQARAHFNGPQFRQAALLSEALDGADVVAIMTPWPQFRNLKAPGGATVIDCWGMME